MNLQELWNKEEGHDIASRLGVKPMDSSASPRQRRRAYFWFRQLLTLSQLLDPLRIPNSFVNYQCVWWKAITGNDKKSPMKDNGLAYDMLPPFTRLAVAPPLAPFYPRFHHGNVELRTKYLDNAIEQILMGHLKKHQKNIRLVLMGGGYDLRSIRMALRYQQDDHEMDLVELDLPAVIEAKKKLWQRRLLRRRPELTTLISSVRLFEVDLNNLAQVEQVLANALDYRQSTDLSESWFTVFVFEAVLIYLDQGIPSQLLSTISRILKERQLQGAICFADTLSNVDNGSVEQARQELNQNGGWELKDWITKPGKTRHLGWTTLSTAAHTSNK